MPLRMALTSREHGPELHFVLAALRREQAAGRIAAALQAAADPRHDDPHHADPHHDDPPPPSATAADDHTTQGDAP